MWSPASDTASGVAGGVDAADNAFLRRLDTPTGEVSPPTVLLMPILVDLLLLDPVGVSSFAYIAAPADDAAAAAAADCVTPAPTTTPARKSA